MLKTQGHNSPLDASLADAYGRAIRYVRLSVTDRCNLRCLYCQSPAKYEYIPHPSILTYEEMLRLAGIFYGLGVRKLRLSGGEPLVRKGCADFLVSLRERFADLDIRMTSNGTLIGPIIPVLARIRVGCVNISLDTFSPDVFAEITGRNMLACVLDNVNALRMSGIPIKLNAVALRGITDRELPAFIAFAKEKEIDVRFIEFMPMGKGTLWSRERFLPVSELRQAAEECVRLRPIESRSPTDGPARMYAIAGSRGRLGFISAVTDHFCSTCNRLRITSDGALRLCLFDDREYALRPLLRNRRVTDESIARCIRALCQRKVIGNEVLLARRKTAVAEKRMSGIGG